MPTVLSKYTTNRDNNFNLIRFVAAVLVLYTHSFALAIGTSAAEPLRDVVGMTWGTIAVDVFFITSGFLICSSFFARNNIFAFAWARIVRIYPALIAAMLFCVLIVGLFSTTLPMAEFLTDFQIYKFFFRNILLVLGTEQRLPGVFVDTPFQYAVNGSLWTLPHEIRMYACLAVICTILLSLRKRIGNNIVRKTFLPIAAFAVLLNIVNHFYVILPVNSLRLFAMFFYGAAFYEYREYIYLSSKLFALCVVALLLSMLDVNTFYVAYAILLPYVIFYLAYVPAGTVRNFNNYGDYSYGIYIYAFPVQQLIAKYIPGVSVGSMILLATPPTFFLAFLSWHIVEKRCLKLKSQYTYFEKLFKRIA